MTNISATGLNTRLAMHGGTGRAIRNSKKLVLISFISSLSNTRTIIEVIDLSRIDNK